ncbi:uncharacterized protein VTP21DRAFT_4285 [Calcarisporiella thermophila]|uniref:uncharacterized protein n=1 Tax=Calcarisporiella thermophila TaxID=911321 RepID=UPI003742E285
MGRHTINQNQIEISYGYDEPLGGYFLSVVDKRLMWKPDMSNEVDEICNAVDMSGSGSYFDLNTYKTNGFGRNISKKAMLEFWKRYGIPEPHIRALKIGEQI